MIGVVVDGVGKSFRRPVLRDVRFVLRPGALTALVGPCGSGKSLLLRLVAGLERADRGRIEIDGEPVTGADARRLARLRSRIGMLFQNHALFDFMTVGENVAFPLRRMGWDEPRLTARVSERLHAVGLAGYEPRAVHGLSGGQKRRVGIARATAAEPALLLFDEPTAGLDPVTGQRILEMVRHEQRARGATALVVSSDVQAVAGVADALLVLHEGRIVYDGPAVLAAHSDEPIVAELFGRSVEARA
ncbi:MAG: ATP-binding cassette domain-containing protein [Myxococcota bacterium]|nr:ATP-binding cassette domain-containing protein [Myxococcota bacterium]MDW8362928.1 ATP-binding cassette domain-containing protein [Myxococcales bacterium]